eukprot:TRINITY_DN13266_c0_g1_i1.p1 TRINITY_DN13266_c0_g1~~TRINITY_DN13266_c0_g1_i1.p1  ORF type:complete len:441 (+),score=66.71 TRINITY_DN13266_c0_g1_i1:146-1324(+)
MTYYGRWTYKYEEAFRRGARAAFIIHHSSEAAGYGWNVVRHGRDGPHFMLPSQSRPEMPLQGWVTLTTAKSIFKLCNRDFAADLKQIKSFTQQFAKDRTVAKWSAYELQNLAISASLTSRCENIQSQNFVGVLDGTGELKREWLVYCAHWDHFGTRTAEDGKTTEIFNGARDNAAGVCAVIEMAHAHKKAIGAAGAPAARRSILFLVPTAEEQGLLGSLHFVRENRIARPERTIAVINFDVLNVFGYTKDISFFGLTKSPDLLRLVEAKARQHGRYISDELFPESGMFYRSDHFMFAKEGGVPGIFLGLGRDHVKHGKEWKLAKEAQWVKECYHTTRDVVVWDEGPWKWDLEGVVADLAVLFDVAKHLLVTTTHPAWHPSCEFSRKLPSTKL